jgi:hypothetical protein
LKSPSEDLPCDTIHEGTLHTREKQLLLDCLLQDPKHAWLHYLDGRQALPVGVLLHLSKLSLTGEEFSQSVRRKT